MGFRPLAHAARRSHYQDGRSPKPRPERPSLDNGWIVPEEIKGLKVRVFVSHSHAVHFDPVIFSWKRRVPDIAYHFGWQVSDDPTLHCFLGPRAELKSGGLEIVTINSHHSGVPEVAWLLKVDGLVIYHNGDCCPANATAENDFLRRRTGVVDLAFLFPAKVGDQYGYKYMLQEEDFFKKLQVRAVFPMHFQAGSDTYVDFQKVFQTEFPGLSIHVPTKLGQEFVLADKKGR